MPDNTVIPFRSVRPMAGSEIVSLNRDTGAAYSQPVDLSAWLNRGRQHRLQRFVAISALTVAGFLMIYFAFQLGRGAL